MADGKENRETGEKLPIAGCPGCGVAAWILQLDAEPPNHTAIVRLWCAGCKAHRDVHIVLADIKDNSNMTEVIDES